MDRSFRMGKNEDIYVSYECSSKGNLNKGVFLNNQVVRITCCMCVN